VQPTTPIAGISTKGSAEYFTGAVRVDMPFKGSAPARIGGAIVTPGAHGMAHPSIGPNAHRDIRHGLGANARWSKGGNPSRRYYLDPAG